MDTAKTFVKELTYDSRVFENDAWKDGPIKKTATFQELDKRSRAQHKLHFRIIAMDSLIKERETDGKMMMDTDEQYDFVVAFVKQMIILDISFTANDLEEFLNDAGALFQFGIWLFTDRVFPFFQKLMGNMAE